MCCAPDIYWICSSFKRVHTSLNHITGGAGGGGGRGSLDVAQKPFKLLTCKFVTFLKYEFNTCSQNFNFINHFLVYFTGTFCRHDRSGHYGLWATAIIIRLMIKNEKKMVDLDINIANITTSLCSVKIVPYFYKHLRNADLKLLQTSPVVGTVHIKIKFSN